MVKYIKKETTKPISEKFNILTLFKDNDSTSENYFLLRNGKVIVKY